MSPPNFNNLGLCSRRLAFSLIALLLAGCATTHPSRQMNEMNTDDLIRELSRPIP